MAQALYIAEIDPGSGKSLVLLGVMELLSKRVDRIGFFRPVIASTQQPDNDIELIRRRYQIEVPYASHYAMTRSEAQQAIATGQLDDLLQTVLEHYKSIENDYDFIVCEGTDFEDGDTVSEFNVNAQVANILAAPVLLVADGSHLSPEDVVNLVRAEHDAFAQAGCLVAATIVNRVGLEALTESIDQLQRIWQREEPVFVLPEAPLLSMPTLAEIAIALDAKLCSGSPDRLKREVAGFKVAAMQVPHFLDHLCEGYVVVVPGDRADIVLACLASSLSDHYPNLAGIVLTGGLDLGPTVQSLIEGVAAWTVPILSVTTDTYETAMRIGSVRAELTPDNDRKIASALGLFETGVNNQVLADRIAVARSPRVTPLMFEYDLIARAKAQRQRIVLPEGNDDRILQATEILLRRNVVDPILLGDEAAVRSRAATLGIDLGETRIINPLTSPWQDHYAETYYQLRQHKGINLDIAHDIMRDGSYFGTMMVYQGEADGMVSGAAHTTAHTIRPALEFIRTRPGVAIVSGAFLMCLRDRVLVFADCAVNPNPNPSQLADIAISSADTARTFHIDPRVALLSYSTGESGQGEDVDKVREATRLARDRRPDLKLEGPIQYDAAIDMGVARSKLPDSEVAGQATVFIFPDLNTGNNTYKAVQRAADAVAIGPVLQGLRKPVNDLSRGCTVADIVNTVAITAIQARQD